MGVRNLRKYLLGFHASPAEGGACAANVFKTFVCVRVRVCVFE